MKAQNLTDPADLFSMYFSVWERFSVSVMASYLDLLNEGQTLFLRSWNAWNVWSSAGARQLLGMAEDTQEKP